MSTKEIMDSISQAGSWLPLVTVRQAFTHRNELATILLEALEKRASAKDARDIVNHRLAAFGVLFLAQNRDRRLFEPLVQLFESTNPEGEDEWIFSGRLFFFGHRQLAGVCPHDRLLRGVANLLLLRHCAQHYDRERFPIRWLVFSGGEAEHRETANLAFRMGGEEIAPRRVFAREL